VYGISLKLTMAAFSLTKHFNVDVPHYISRNTHSFYSIDEYFNVNKE
jgi:hypothetical protein